MKDSEERTRPDVTRAELLNRIRRIGGQVGGVERMIQDNRYCVDILLQISAVRSALHSLALLVLDDHLQVCVSRAMRGEGEISAEQVQEELIEVLRTYIR